MKLSDDLKHWRAERPDEWKMNEFIRKALQLEQKVTELSIQQKPTECYCETAEPGDWPCKFCQQRYKEDLL